MADQQELARDLGFLEAYTIGLGTMIGAGIFVLPSIAAANAGPASMISFAIGGVVSLLAALSLSELATGMPRAGGSYYYVNQALGGFFGSIVGWGMWSGLMFASAFYMLGFAQYMTYFYGNLPVVATALVMSIFLIYINYRGTRETATFQNMIVIVLVGIILIFIVFGILEVNLEILKPFNPKGWGAVAATAATVYVSFIGFEVIATSAEEIKDPGRNLPLSMVASVLTPTLLYVLVMFVSTGILPIPRLVESNIPVAQVADVVMGATGSLMMVLGAVLATVSSANASILSAARVNFAMGRDRLLSNWLNEVHNQYRTPYRSIVVTGVVILVLIALGVGIETLANVASFMYLLTYSLVHLAVIVMRRANLEEYRPDFRLPDFLYPVVPVAGFIACIVILSRMQLLVELVGSLITLFGAGWYLFYAKHRAPGTHLIGEAIANPASRVHTTNDAYRIVVPVANPATERYLLRLASASAKTHDNGEIVAVNVIEVPDQTALQQDVVFEEERIKKQQEILDTAREFSTKQNVGLRTRAILGRDVAENILNVLNEEDADQVLLGWRGVRQPREYILGSNIDPIVRRAPCEVTLVRSGGKNIGSVVALCGEGPHAPVAARRGYEFSQAAPESSLTLLRVEPPGEGDTAPEERGQEVIRTVAQKAGVSSDDYKAKVLVQKDIRGTLLSCGDNYQTVCVGATRGGRMEKALFGSIPEQIGEQSSATVAMVRGQQSTPRSILEAIIERLELER